MRKILTLFASLSFLALAPLLARAQNVLANPGFEEEPILPGWTLTETVTGMPGAAVNSGQIQDFANQPTGAAGEAGLWLRSFAGNLDPFANQNKMINASLSQTVPGTAGENYTFTGWSRWEMNYSGAVTTLAAGSPSGAVPSPTDSAFELAFLDASNAVIGTPVSVDLRSTQMGDNMWRQHTVMGMAPAGTTSVRVTAAATDMVFNTDPQQSGFYDNFSLTGASAPATEKLDNASLNAPLQTPGWTFIESPSGVDTAALAGFANRVGTGNGVWLRPFATAVPEGEATITQTVSGTPGTAYTFSGWSRWEANYSGGQTGTPTQTRMELAFLDATNAVIGTPLTLDLRTEQMNDNMWRQHFLSGVAPAGTANVRVSAIANAMFNTSGAQSAFFDDLLLVIPEPASAILGLLAMFGMTCHVRRR